MTTKTKKRQGDIFPCVLSTHCSSEIYSGLVVGLGELGPGDQQRKRIV